MDAATRRPAPLLQEIGVTRHPVNEAKTDRSLYWIMLRVAPAQTTGAQRHQLHTQEIRTSKRHQNKCHNLHYFHLIWKDSQHSFNSSSIQLKVNITQAELYRNVAQHFFCSFVCTCYTQCMASRSNVLVILNNSMMRNKKRATQYYSWSHFICLISCVLCIIKSPSSHLRPLASSLCDTLTTLLHRFLSSPALDIASDGSYKRYDPTTCVITWWYVV